MDLMLKGKAALLIGAGRGIGGAAALAMAREGCKLALMARSAADLDARKRDCLAAGASEVHAIAADALDRAQLANAIDRAADAMGAIDILVTLVGGSQPGGTADLDDAGWESALAKNFACAVRASRFALPHLEKSAARARAFHEGANPRTAEESTARGDEGSVARPIESGTAPFRSATAIVHVSSIWGREGGGSMSYNAAKAALISLAHEQARELAPRGIRVCSVAPGSVLHPGGSWEKRLQKDPEGIAAFVKREIPFGRFGSAAELGEVICFLASPRASWISGACVVVDGAQSHAF